jgi:hypothetical protein
MEFDEQKDIKIKSVIEKSSVLEEVYNKAHQYEIIDEF